MELVYFVLVFILIAVIGYISDLVIKDIRKRESDNNREKTEDIYCYLRTDDEEDDEEQPEPVRFETPKGVHKHDKLSKMVEDMKAGNVPGGEGQIDRSLRER